MQVRQERDLQLLLTRSVNLQNRVRLRQLSTREPIQGSIHDVEEGNKAVALVSETLDEVIKGINDIADTSKSLSENSQSQATAMEQAEQGVNQISEVVQSNSAMAQ